MKKGNIKIICDSIANKVNAKGSKLHSLEWDGDLRRCINTAYAFIEKIAKSKNMKHISIANVFMSREARAQLKNMIK